MPLSRGAAAEQRPRASTWRPGGGWPGAEGDADGFEPPPQGAAARASSEQRRVDADTLSDPSDVGYFGEASSSPQRRTVRPGTEPPEREKRSSSPTERRTLRAGTEPAERLSGSLASEEDVSESLEAAMVSGPSGLTCRRGVWTRERAEGYGGY